MALLPNFKLGLKSYGEAHRIVVKHRLWGYVFLPAIINSILLILLIVAGWHYIEQFTLWFFDITGLSSVSTGFFKFISVIIKVLIKIILYIILFLFYFSVYRYIVLMLLSPALALLSEKTEKILTGKSYAFNFKQFIRDVFRGIGIAIRNFFIETGWLILCFICGFIPIVGWVAPVFMFFVSCYFYGFSMLDYTNERARLNIRESVRFIRKNRGMAVANGMVFYFFFFLVPVVGFILAPAYSVIAATIASLKTRNSIAVSIPEKKVSDH